MEFVASVLIFKDVMVNCNMIVGCDVMQYRLLHYVIIPLM